MAINPLLVSIKQASDLTTAIPTTDGFFFYYEDGDLRKASMTDIYNKVNGAFGGLLMLADNPAPTVPTWFFAGESGTYTNAGGLVADTTGKLVIFNYDGTAWSMLETAALQGEPGVDGVDADPAKLPIYNPANSYVTDSQFIKNGVIYKVSTGTLAAGEAPETSAKVAAIGFGDKVEGSVFPVLSFTDGFYINGAGSLTEYHIYQYTPVAIPIPDGVTQIEVNFAASYTLAFYDASEVFITNEGKSPEEYNALFNVPSNAKFVKYSQPKAEANPYIKFIVPFVGYNIPFDIIQDEKNADDVQSRWEPVVKDALGLIEMDNADKSVIVGLRNGHGAKLFAKNGIGKKLLINNMIFNPDTAMYKVDLFNVNNEITAFGSGINFLQAIDFKIAFFGDSTAAAYACRTTTIASHLFDTNEVGANYVATNKAFPGAKIEGQNTEWNSDPNKATYDVIIIMVGLNNLETDNISTILTKYQAFVDAVNAGKKVGAKVILNAMIPVKSAIAGAPLAQQNWVDLNDAIMNGTITGADYRNDYHVSLLGDGSGNLAPAYNCGDGVHENQAGADIIAEGLRIIIRTI